jgi:hypothetical protein
LNQPQQKNRLSATHFFQQEITKGVSLKEDVSFSKKIELNLNEEMEKESTLKIHKRSMEDFEKTLPSHMPPAELGETIKDNYHSLKNGPAGRGCEL